MRAAPNRRRITYDEVPERASGAGPGAGCTLDVSTVAETSLVIDTHHGRAVLLWDAGRPRRPKRQGKVSAARPAASYQVDPITDVSSCSGQNAEVEQAVDPKLGYVYEEWMGCRGIAVARSADGGRTWDAPVSLPGTVGSNINTWDPAIAVAPDGTVYASFMLC